MLSLIILIFGSFGYFLDMSSFGVGSSIDAGAVVKKPSDSGVDFESKAFDIADDIKKLLDGSVEDSLVVAGFDFDDLDNAGNQITEFYDSRASEVWFNKGSDVLVREERVDLPLYSEISFIDKNGLEKIKYKADGFSNDLKNVKVPENTEYKSETYFQETSSLKSGFVNIGRLMTWYTFKEDIFSDLPEADFNNYEKVPGRDLIKNGVIRFSSPVYRDDEFLGVVVLSLDYRHLQETSKHFDPSREGEIVSATYSGGYLLVYDDEGSTIIHPKPDNIRGNLESGELAGFNNNVSEPIGKIFNLYLYHKSKAYPEMAAKTLEEKSPYTSLSTDVSGRNKLTLAVPILYSNANTNYVERGVFGGIMMSLNLESSDTRAGRSSSHTLDRGTLLAEDTIRQKAESVAKQIEIYLNSHPNKTIKDLQNDSYFKEIAVQPVGKTGYTAVTDSDTGEFYFTPQDSLVGKNIDMIKDLAPDVWNFIYSIRGNCKDQGLFYNWPEDDGTITKKYTYVACIDIKTADGKNLIVDASTSLDEFDQTNATETVSDNTTRLIFWLTVLVILLIGALFALNKVGILEFEKNVILVFLSVTLLIIIGLFLFSTYQTTENLKVERIDAVALQLSSLIDSQERFLKYFVEEQEEKIEIAATHFHLTNEELNAINDANQEFYEISALYPNGTVESSSNVLQIGIDKSMENYFLENGSDMKPIYDEDSGKVIILVSAPFHDGMIIGKIDIKIINEIFLSTSSLGESGESLLAYKNENGDAEFFTEKRFGANISNIIPKENVNIPVTQALLKNEGVFLSFDDYRDVPVIAVTRYVDELGIGVVVKIDREEILIIVSDTIRKIWLFTFGLVAVIVFVGLIFYLLLTKSLRDEIGKKTSEIKSINVQLENIVKDRTKELIKKSKELENLNLNLKKEVNLKTAELRKKVEDLKRTKTAVLNMMEDMQSANEELKTLDKTKTEFLNIVSHELKTPLTAMIAHLDVLDDLRSNLTKEEMHSLEAIRRNSNNLQMLIGNILEVARMESGKFELTRNRVNVKELVGNVVKKIDILSKQKNLELVTKIPKLPLVNVDVGRVDEILNNLISNAIKFTEKGSVTISAKNVGDFVEVSVSDSGVGIPEEKIKNLFRKFYQVDASISRRYGGTGLGLSITRQLVEAHGGKIIVKSGKGKGTTFTFTLPTK